MRQWLIFVLLTLSLCSFTAYATEVGISDIDAQPPAIDTPAEVPTEPPVEPPIEPFPEAPPELGEDLPADVLEVPTVQIAESLNVETLAALQGIKSHLDLYTFVIIPFGFAFFICWQLGRFFFRTFFQ